MKSLILICALLAGCATPEREYKWEKPGASDETWYVDRGACRMQAYSVAEAPRPQIVAVFEACLESKGWRRASP